MISSLPVNQAALQSPNKSAKLFLIKKTPKWIRSPKPFFINELFADFEEGIAYGADGEIINYDNLKEWIKKEYNDNINAAGADTQAIEKLFSEREKAIELYEQALDEANKTVHEINDNLREQAQLALDEITYKMQIVIEIKDAKKQLKEF